MHPGETKTKHWFTPQQLSARYMRCMQCRVPCALWADMGQGLPGSRQGAAREGGGEEDEFWKLISSAQLHVRSPPPTTGSAVVHADAHHQLQPALAFRVHHQQAKPSNRCSSNPLVNSGGVHVLGGAAGLQAGGAAGLQPGGLKGVLPGGAARL
ncbi:hypothetical protein HaLaN_16563 [Haematococcus lacustris]|uniref:Uncharacterized protein n=1 Tax=Haematococcus lacustris TaxID=44745 RepID=A0A699ZKT9_HAELA|nr:hypothetical protein HaLaN_16563 [Haematococcus lacustris]